MFRVGNAQVWVHDQDEALEFYTAKLGMEVRSDVTLPEMGNFRWLTVGPVGQDDFAIVLMAVPGPPVYDSTVFLVTDDCQKDYEDLASRGVEFQETPEERPYGIDAGFRDPSGNNFRLTQVNDRV